MHTVVFVCIGFNIVLFNQRKIGAALAAQSLLLHWPSTYS